MFFFHFDFGYIIKTVTFKCVYGKIVFSYSKLFIYDVFDDLN